MAALLVPQAAAYAFLAELPAGAGFLAAAFAPIGYLLFATSRHLSVGPVALLSLLTATAISSAGGNSLEVAAQLSLLVGGVMILIGVLRIGHLTNFISEPVLTGFIAGAALVIGMTQAGNFLGIDLKRGGTFVESLQSLLTSLGETNYHALSFAVATLAGLLAAPWLVGKLCKRLEFSDQSTATLSNLSLLAVLLLAVLATYLTNAPVERVGVVQVSLPHLEWITFGGIDGIRRLLPDAIVIAVVGYVLAYGTAASLAGRRRLSVDRDFEAGALGLANVTAAFAGGYPVGASLSRSAVASTLNAFSTLACVLAGVITLGIGLASLGIFAHVAKAVLAAVIMKAVLGMIDVPAIVRFVRYRKADAAGVLVTLVSVLGLGIRWGIAIGALTSVFTHLLLTSRPRIVRQGLPDDESGPMRDVSRRDMHRAPRKVLVMRMDDHLYFGGAAHLEEQIAETVAEYPHIEHLVLSLEAAGIVDATGLEMLRRVNENLREAGVTLHLAHARKPVERQLRHAGLVGDLQRERIFDSAKEALETLTNAD